MNISFLIISFKKHNKTSEIQEEIIYDKRFYPYIEHCEQIVYIHKIVICDKIF